MTKNRNKRQRGTSNAEMRGYLKILAMTNSAIVNSTEAMIDGLVTQFNVPYQRAETVVNTFRRDTRIAR